MRVSRATLVPRKPQRSLAVSIDTHTRKGHKRRKWGKLTHDSEAGRAVGENSCACGSREGSRSGKASPLGLVSRTLRRSGERRRERCHRYLLPERWSRYGTALRAFGADRKSTRLN